MPRIYTYGKDKAPTSWQDAADILKGNRGAKRPKPKRNEVEAKLDNIEKLLEKK